MCLKLQDLIFYAHWAVWPVVLMKTDVPNLYKTIRLLGLKVRWYCSRKKYILKGWCVPNSIAYYDDLQIVDIFIFERLRANGARPKKGWVCMLPLGSYMIINFKTFTLLYFYLFVKYVLHRKLYRIKPNSNINVCDWIKYKYVRQG